jgi:hypothetical protein
MRIARGGSARVTAEYAVGARFEARNVTGYELWSDGDRVVVDLELHSAREPKIHLHGSGAGNGLDAIGAPVARE